jgi:hypothetical protein
VTVPEFTVLVLVTFAVNRIACDVVDGLGDDVKVVVVAASPLVVNVSFQPAMLDVMPPLPESSVTYRLHVPFGAAPPNTEAKVEIPFGGAELYGPAGAGAGNTSDSTA